MKALFSVLALAALASVVRSADPPQAVATVVAEGIGTTADEAVKDAFRNAIRQCVGAIVDAETLVKNDKVITDKVITHSNGYVKTYKELSKTEDKGVFRVRISAQVERRDLIKRLTDANVKIANIDGKGLFAQVVTDLEAAKSAKEILERFMTAFSQKCVVVQTVGKPEVVEKNETSAKLAFYVTAGVDLKEYSEASKTLFQQLSSLSKPHGSFTITFSPVSLLGILNGSEMPAHASQGCMSWKTPVGRTRLQDNLNGMMPNVYADKEVHPRDKKSFVVALCSSFGKDLASFSYTYFVVDSSCADVLYPLAAIQTRGSLILSGEGGKVIKRQPFPFKEFNPEERTQILKTAEASLITGIGLGGTVRGHDPRDTDILEKSQADLPIASKATGVLISPAFLRRNSMIISHVPKFAVRVETTLTLEELKLLKEVKVELVK